MVALVLVPYGVCGVSSVVASLVIFLAARLVLGLVLDVGLAVWAFFVEWADGAGRELGLVVADPALEILVALWVVDLAIDALVVGSRVRSWAVVGSQGLVVCWVRRAV